MLDNLYRVMSDKLYSGAAAGSEGALRFLYGDKWG